MSTLFVSPRMFSAVVRSALESSLSLSLLAVWTIVSQLLLILAFDFELILEFIIIRHVIKFCRVAICIFDTSVPFLELSSEPPILHFL